MISYLLIKLQISGDLFAAEPKTMVVIANSSTVLNDFNGKNVEKIVPAKTVLPKKQRKIG